MGIFLKKSGVFALIGILLILSAIGLSIILRNRTFQPDKNYFCLEFRKGYHEVYPAEIILLGNSRILSGLSSSEMERITGKRVLQLGYSSSNLSVTRLVLESYLRDAAAKPEEAILEVSWFTFNPKRTGFHRQFAGDLAMNEPLLLRYSFRYPELFQSWMTRLAYHALVPGPKVYMDYSIDKRREYPSNDSATKDYTVDIRTMEKIFPDHIAGTDPQLLADFHVIVEMCLHHQIRLILYTGPEDEGYTHLQLDRSEVKEQFINALRTPGVYYLDYTVDGPFYRKENENILLNSDHIWFEDIFTRQFTADLKQLNLL
jgi:hypothetical protein